MGPVAAAAAGGIAEGVITSAFNAWQAEKSRDYNREMASTAHQREVKDLRKAGLNPILSAGGHGAAVAPSPTAQAGHFDATGKALQAMQIQQQGKLMDAQIADVNSAAKLKDAQAKALGETQPLTLEKMRTEINDILAGTGVKNAQVNEIAERIKEYQARVKLLNAQADTESVRSQKDKAFEKLWQGLRSILGGADNAIRSKIPKLLEWSKRSKDIMTQHYQREYGSAKQLEGGD